MTLLLYTGAGKAGQRLKKRIYPLVPDQVLETCGSIDRLIQRLRRPVGDLSLVVLLTGSQKEFKKIVGIGDLLRDIRTIIILPDSRPETISSAHKLHPRLISYADGDFKDISAVVGKMLGRLYPQN